MLSLFPQILFLAPLSATILRLAAALVFLSIAYTHYVQRRELAEQSLPLVGRALWVVPFAIVIEILIAVSLGCGIYTQLGAVVGAIGAAKFFALKNVYPRFIPLSRTASGLLFVICISLLLTGAGAFAFDLPL